MIMAMFQTNTRPRHPKKKLAWILIVGLLVVGMGAWVVWQQTNQAPSKQPKTTTKESAIQPGVTVTTSSDAKPAEDAPKPTGDAPVKPYGMLVSHHKPNLDGEPVPNTLNSVCQTTPGAMCEVQFQK